MGRSVDETRETMGQQVGDKYCTGEKYKEDSFPGKLCDKQLVLSKIACHDRDVYIRNF